MSDASAAPGPATAPRSSRMGLVVGLVTLLVAALAVAWVITTDHVRDQVKVQPIGTTCGDRVHRYGAPDGEYDDEDDGGVITGFGVTDRELARAKWCEVEVQISNTESRGVEVLSRTHGYMSRGEASGFPARVRSDRGLESSLRDDQSPDATIDESFDLDPGDSARVSWKIELRPNACDDKGLIGASLVTFRIRTVLRTLVVDPGLTFSIQTLSDRSKNCAE